METLKDILEKKDLFVVEIEPTASVTQAAALLASHNIGALVIRDDQRRLVGIVSERDIVRVVAKSDSAATSAPVSSVMSRNVRTCSPTSGIQESLAQMDEFHIRHLPVIVDEDVVGIISIRDLMSAVLENMRRENDDLQDMSDLLAEMYANADAEHELQEDGV